MDSFSVGAKTDSRMSVDLLDMLAEVASNSLQHDPSFATPSKKHKTGCQSIHKRTNQLLRLFSKFDGDEMRRKFTFTCTFDVGGCETSFYSFGSELKARQSMKSHLVDHVQHAGESTDCAFYKQRKLRLNRKSDNKKGGKSYVELSEPDFIPQPLNNKLDKSFQLLPNRSCQRSKMAQCDFKHFCGKAKCDKPTRTATQPNIRVVYDEHNYTAQKKSSASISSIANFVELGNSNFVEIVDTLEKDVTSSLNNFMMLEVNSDVVFATCLEKNNSELTNLPHVGVEVAVSTTATRAFATLEGNSSSHGLFDVPYGDTLSRVLVHPEIISHHKGASDGRGNKADVKLTASSKGGNITAEKLSDKELAIQLIAEAKYKRSSKALHCTICSPPRHFTAVTTLISHYRSHAGIKPFECPICRRSFTRQHSLKYHLLIHQNATRFTCGHCARKFRHPSHFREHLRKHTGEEPFQCVDCAARFKTRNTFKRHLKSRHGKVLTASGELIQVADDTIEIVPAEQVVPSGLLSTTDEQETHAPDLVVCARREVGNDNVLGQHFKVEDAGGQAYFETNSTPATWSPSDIFMDVVTEEIYRDDNSSRNTRDVLSNDSNNNATNQSAFPAVSNGIPKTSIYGSFQS